jgi:hypothetical protein
MTLARLGLSKPHARHCAALAAIGDPGSAESHAHSPTQQLDVRQSLGSGSHEKPANRPR